MRVSPLSPLLAAALALASVRDPVGGPDTVPWPASIDVFDTTAGAGATCVTP